MKFKFKIIISLISLLITTNCMSGIINAEEAKNPGQQVEKSNTTKDFLLVQPLDLVEDPETFLNKKVKMQAEFHRFTTLGLDYEKAFRDSKDFISILIKRPDTVDEHTIPLSEMKLIIKRDDAENLLNLESGDKIEITGKVFSSALSDPWVDIFELKTENHSEKSEDIAKE